MQPIFDSSCFGVAKTVRGLVGSSCYFSKVTFDTVPIPMCFRLESQSVPVTGSLQPWHGIDVKERGVDEMFLTKFSEEQLDECLDSRRIESHVQHVVRRVIDSSVQPVLHVNELDHGFIDHNVIRISTVERL